MKSYLYLVPNKIIPFESKFILNKESFSFVNLPLKGFSKYIYFFFNIFYPISRLNHSQIYLLLNLIFRRTSKLVTYTYASKRIQDLSLKFDFFKIIQIQNGVLTPISQKSLNLKHIDIFLTISKFQSNNALNNFAKKAFVVGSLSTENWIKNVEIANKISGFQYDICFICNAHFKDDVKYALNLVIDYVLSNKNLQLFLAIKSKTKLNDLAEYCIEKFKIDLFNHEQISFPNHFDKLTTIKNALKSKIVVGVRSTTLFQLGSLGFIVYPIDISKPYGSLSGNLSELNLNLCPSKKLFLKKIKELSTQKGRENYFRTNYKVLKELDETLLLNDYPSKNIIKYIKKN